MTRSALGRHALQLLSYIAIAIAVIAVREIAGAPPAWSYWISVAIFALMGGVALSAPHDISGMRAAFARASGIAFLAVALLLAFALLTSQFPFK